MDTTQLEADVALRFSIFVDESRFDWDQQLRYAREQTLYSPDLIKRYIASLTLLRQWLGESFLRQVRYAHPLANMILEAGHWQVRRVCDYTDQLHYLSDNDPDFPGFRQKLLSSVDASQEIMPFLNIGHLFRSTGMDIRFPVEKVGQKNPDAVFTDPGTGQIIYGEVSQVGKSQEHQDNEHNYNRLRRVLSNHLTNPLYSAIQLQPMPDSYLAALGPLLAALQQHVATTNLPLEYADAYFTIKLFPLSQQEELYTWMATYNRRKDLNGPPQDFDETRRISSNKIARKSKQLPADTPGILFIPLSPLHFWQQKVSETMAIFQQRMRDLPQVLGVFMFAECLHVHAEDFRFNADDSFDRTVITDALIRYSLFVPNPAFNQPINPNTRKKVLAVLAPRLANFEK